MQKKLTVKVPERFEDNFGDAINKFLKILPDLNEDLDEIIAKRKNMYSDEGKNKFY
jgi:DNA-directed RNA polymerase subunit F